MPKLDCHFEVTQILASRVDDAGHRWYLVQWGCTWIPREAMVDGPIKTAWATASLMDARVAIPQADADDVVVSHKRSK